MSFIASRPATRTASTYPLTDDQIRAVAPSVFAEAAHESRSARYTYIPTAAVLAGLRTEGFVPFFAQQGRCRIAGKAEFTKHVIRFRREGWGSREHLIAQRELGTFPEVALVNSHDGTSSYVIEAALFRLWCLNGAVAKERDLETLKVGHKGNVVDKVIEGSYRVLDNSLVALEHATEWAGVDLTERQQLALARGAHALRFGDAEGNVETAIEPQQMLTVRRPQDNRNDLWTAFNRCQENGIRGGLEGVRTTEDGRTRRTTTRGINSIDGDLRYNRALWEMTAALKEMIAA